MYDTLDYTMSNCAENVEIFGCHQFRILFEFNSVSEPFSLVSAYYLMVFPDALSHHGAFLTICWQLAVSGFADFILFAALSLDLALIRPASHSHQTPECIVLRLRKGFAVHTKDKMILPDKIPRQR